LLLIAGTPSAHPPNDPPNRFARNSAMVLMLLLQGAERR
jgi:hypothetical protein